MKKFSVPLLFVSLLLGCILSPLVLPSSQGQVSSPYARRYLPRTFAQLGTPANGSVFYCSNCTQANPCASGGSGAVAERINGAWVCNGGASGGVGGSTGATDNAILRADGTGGATVQSSGASIDDTGKLTAVGATFSANVLPSAGNSWRLGNAGGGQEWLGVDARTFLVGASDGFVTLTRGGEATTLKVADSGGTAGAAVQLLPKAATPATPSASSEGNIYIKGGKLIIQYMDGATERWKYLDLTGTSVTWTHTTTAP